MKARYPGICGVCQNPIVVGQEISSFSLNGDRQDHKGWMHDTCTIPPEWIETDRVVSQKLEIQRQLREEHHRLKREKKRVEIRASMSAILRNRGLVVFGVTRDLHHRYDHVMYAYSDDVASIDAAVEYLIDGCIAHYMWMDDGQVQGGGFVGCGPTQSRLDEAWQLAMVARGGDDGKKAIRQSLLQERKRINVQLKGLK
jgi:hypothetical protein